MFMDAGRVSFTRVHWAAFSKGIRIVQCAATIDCFSNLSNLRGCLASYRSHIGRSLIDPGVADLFVVRSAGPSSTKQCHIGRR